MQEWMYPFNDAVFCSWGNYDRGQFIQDCRFHAIDYPFGSGHVNLKVEFSKSLNLRRRFGIGGAIKYLGLEFEGTHHRGIDDVRNIARIVRRVCSGR
jgi:inhibitor of KinA sporulation pathway (predicted exonuclease)